MYSDSPYDDGSLGPLPSSEPNMLDFNANFDLNSYAASPSFTNPLLQTAPRAYETGMYQYAGSAAGGMGMGSPAPSTIKKLKSTLDGIGMGGGYLCSPVAAARSQQGHLQQQQYQQNYVPVPDTMSVPSPVPVNMANLPAMPPPATTQPMQRLKSAPASIPVASTSASAIAALQPGPSTTTRRKASGKTNNIPVTTVVDQQQSQQSVGLGIPEASFEELDYGNMRIYGRPLARSASADPAMKGSKGGSGSFLPYPEHLPTVTLGRGMKNVRDVAAPQSHATDIFARAESSSTSNTQANQPVMKQSNLDKPYIQYVPPDSPAAKSANRNRNKLSINTGSGAAKSGKLVPVRMSPKKTLPLTPPMTSTSILSPNLVPVPYNSPQKAAAMGYHGHNHVQTAPMPSFEFSLEQYGELTGHNMQGEPQHMDLAAMLGLPTPGTDTYPSSVASSNGLLSPGPLSTTSSHSSVFSSNDGLDNMFGFPSSPAFYPGDSNSIDQALASLLEGNALQNGAASAASPGAAPQAQQHLFTQQQIDDILSPQLAPQPSVSLEGLSSPAYQPQYPASPGRSAQHSQSPYKPSLYDPFQANIDPSLQAQQMQAQASQVFSPTHQAIASGTLLLSPRASHYGSNVTTASGRLMSSPRRLQAMKSAPDLGSMYHAGNHGYQNSYPSFAHSPTPRKASLKRGYTDGSEDEYDEYGEGASDESVGDDEYRPRAGSGQPPLKKRSMSNLSAYSSGAGSSVAVPQLHGTGSTPNRLRPGPKAKSSMPNLQSHHQSVFSVEVNAPPVPALPRAFSQSASATSDDMEGQALPQSGISKDQLAEYYHVGQSNRQTKKGRPQRMYICGIAGCGKEFPRKSAVESHIQTHLEDKPFACPYDDW